jgi:hypothetical protein
MVRSFFSFSFFFFFARSRSLLPSLLPLPLKKD